jgi:cytochrome c biogenesis protein CcmG, thiol:disulfide interchange protein DsbE
MPPTTDRNARPGGSRPPVLVFAALAVVVLVAVVAVIVTGGDDGEDVATDTAPTTPADVDDDEAASSAQGGIQVTGDPLPEYAPDTDDRAVGRTAPELVGRDFEGREVRIGDDGRPKAVLFVAHWCPHCQREVPAVQSWIDAGNAPADVDLYSVATGNTPDRPNYPPDAWLEQEGWTVPVAVDGDDQAAATAYGLTGYPYWVFIGADGTVASRYGGVLPTAELETILASTASAGAGT